MIMISRNVILSCDESRASLLHLRNNGINEHRAMMLVAEHMGGVYDDTGHSETPDTQH